MTAFLYVQGDGTLLVQSDHPAYDAARATLLTFTELSQRLDPIHVYQMRPITLWQAASLGASARGILTFLRKHAAHPIPYALQQLVVEEMSKWGKLSLQQGGNDRIVLRGDAGFVSIAKKMPGMKRLLLESQPEGLVFNSRHRADVKRLLASNGYPVFDRVGYRVAPSIPFSWLQNTELRDYQSKAIQSFFDASREHSGVVVLPCGAGKTLVGIGILQQLQMHALILTPNETSAQQWRREFLERTDLTGEEVSMYAPDKPLTPITITTYQRVTAKTRKGERPHLTTLTSYPWGIVVYDEVHMLPAPLFRLAADLQSARRLGLTATLVREDGAEADVFSLIGSKCYEVPWKQLEQAGYLASVRCVEVRVALPPAQQAVYQQAQMREKHKIASLNPAKVDVLKQILQQHTGEGVLILGHYLDLLTAIASDLNCPLLTGQTPQDERLVWLNKFRSGEIRCLVLSRIANMAVDLPSASVAIQVSGLFGSRQEEAQRLGRLLRPKTSQGVFYSLVSENTVEERMSSHRQLYLVEQGYDYEIVASQEIAQERVIDREAVGMPE